MDYKWVTFPIYGIAVIYFAAVLVIKPHLGVFYGPSIGKGFPVFSSCDTNIQALAIASGAIPFLHEGGDFGLIQAAQTLQENPCKGFQLRQFENGDWTSIQNLGELMAGGVLKPPPPAVLFRQTHNSLPNGYYPRWPLGYIWLLITNYPKLYSGKGIKHYLRCDYSLNLQPYHSFILSDLHLGNIADATRERINECALLDAYHKEINDFISASLMLPPVYQH